MAAVFIASLWTMVQWSLLLAQATFFTFGCWDELVLNRPIVGMFPSLLLNFHRLHDWMTDVLGKTGSTMLNGPWFTHMDVLCTHDPANIDHIFNTNFSGFPKDQNSQESSIFLEKLLSMQISSHGKFSENCLTVF